MGFEKRKPMASRFRGHTGGIYGASFIQGNRLLVSSGNDKAVRIWDLQKGECICTYHHEIKLERHLDPECNGSIIAVGNSVLRLENVVLPPPTVTAVRLWNFDVGLLQRHGRRAVVESLVSLLKYRREIVAGHWDDRFSALSLLRQTLLSYR